MFQEGELLTGMCPDPQCKKLLYFSSNQANVVECLNCGQHHQTKFLLNVEPVSDTKLAMRNILQNMIRYKIPDNMKKTGESIKVNGLSNYTSKLVSPLLTKYGLDKNTQQVKLLSEMGQTEVFDCSHLADRAFLIGEENLLIKGYGRDSSVSYLHNTLTEVEKINNNEERLVPIYVDGDGHCLLHAISRALVGREIFWHPLATNLKTHFVEHQTEYKNLFRDFIEDTEWNDIISEADPNFVPTYGEMHGLRNIHVFGLANCLHRPIILIDSLEGMHSKGDYCAVFLPALVPLEKCRNNNGTLHKPVLISWSNKGRNHFVPLVGIRGKPLPKFPRSILPKIWGLPQALLSKYIDFVGESCVIGGDKALSERYILKLVSSMEKHFEVLKGVAPSVVADVYHNIIRPSGYVGASMDMVTDQAHQMIKEKRLYQCLLCGSVIDQPPPCPLNWLEPGGKLYDIAKHSYGTLKDGCQYRFPTENFIVCVYSKEIDKLEFVQDTKNAKCKHCNGALRLLKADGSLAYFNGDQLTTPASNESRCGCGFKHYWNGKEYDNLPLRIPVKLEWNNVTKTDSVYWFQYEMESLNSNAFELAQNMVQKHFPGVFGSERLVEKVVDQIFCYVVSEEPKTENELQCESKTSPENLTQYPDKIILTGAKSKVLHKEELTASKTEQILRKKIEHGAIVKQKRLSSSPLKRISETQPKQNHVSPKQSSPERLDEQKENIANMSERTKPKECKIRISTIGSGSEVFIVTEQTRFNDIQSFIEEKFEIEKDLQIIKYGFPPKTLQQSDDPNEQLDLKHGERLTVHLKKLPPKLEETRKEQEMDIDFLEASDPPTPQYNDSNTTALEKTLFAMLDNIDLWDWAANDRKNFQCNGLFYKQAYRDLGMLNDNQHFSLPCFPNKLFSYSEKEDELLLCLGPKHIPVQPLTAEQENLAYHQSLKHQRPRMFQLPQENVVFSLDTFEDRSAKKNNTQAVFSGVGYTLKPQSQEPETKEENAKERIDIDRAQSDNEKEKDSSD